VSFRLKTILGIALIEAVLLALLVVLGVHSVQQLGRNELATRAATTATLAQAMVEDAVVATDLGALQTFVKAVAATRGVVYARILADGRVLAAAGPSDALARPFIPDVDTDVDRLGDGMYHVARDVVVGGRSYGQIQLGLDTGSAAALADATRRQALLIAGVEMLLVAAFSWVLGTFLTRQLGALRAGASRLAEGDFSQPIPVRGSDELAATADAFNTMTQRLQTSDAELRQALRAQTEAARQLGEQSAELQRRRQVMEAVSEIQRTYIEGRGQDDTCRLAIVHAVQLSGAGCAFLAELVPDGGPALARLTVEAHMLCPAASWDAVLGRFSAALANAVTDADHLQLDAEGPVSPALAAAGAGLSYRALLALPIRLGGRVAALLCLARGDRRFSDAEVQDLQPLRSTLGQLLGAWHSEARRAEAAAAAQRLLAELDAIFSLSPDGFAFFDAQSRLTVCNPALASMLGRSADTLQDLDQDGFDALLADLGAGAAPARDGSVDVLRLQRPRPQILQRSVRGVRAADGSEIGRVLYLRDITHESEVDRMKTEFLSTAAHELRTPMASIHGFAELLLSRRFDEGTQHELLQTIHQQSQALVQLVNELLDLARIEARAGKDLNIASCELPPLVHAAVAALKLPGAAHHIEVELAPLLPRVDLDPKKFAQAFTNVLSNAIKYAPGGGVIRIRAELAERDARACVALHVADPGIGMTPEQLARVFERFYRADASGSIPGTGLGMSLVREIVTLHRGDVTLASTPGVGTTVTLWLRLSSALASSFAEL